MKKNIFKTILLLSSIIVLASCSNPLLDDPRIYNKPTTNTDNSNPKDPDVDLNEEGTFTPFDKTNEWYNNPSCNGDDSKKDKVGFDASEFDTLALTSWFNTHNVPQYEIEKKDVWKIHKGTTTNQYEYNGPNTRSKAKDKNSGFEVTNVYYYKNKGYNPLYSPDTNTKLAKTTLGAPRLERFLFYSFKGDCMGQKLDNYLIAIDTYSKFIYAYAKPTGFKEVVGNQVPTGWGIVDEGKLFYEYDPVGYIEKNADNTYEIHIYKWFEDNLAINDYNSVINPEYKTIAQKSPNGQGRSPFYVPEGAPKSFSDNVKGKTFGYRNDNGLGKILYSAEFDIDGKSLKVTQTKWNKTSSIVLEATLSKGTSLTEAMFMSSDNKTYNLSLNDDITILNINDTPYTYNFSKDKDLGPSFENRIDPSIVYKVILSKNTFKFNEDYSLTSDIKDKNPKVVKYSFVEDHDRNIQNAHAVYKDEAGLYFGVQLGSDSTKLSLTKGFTSKEEIVWTKWHTFANKPKK